MAGGVREEVFDAVPHSPHNQGRAPNRLLALAIVFFRLLPFRVLQRPVHAVSSSEVIAPSPASLTGGRCGRTFGSVEPAVGAARALARDASIGSAGRGGIQAAEVVSLRR